MHNVNLKFPVFFVGHPVGEAKANRNHPDVHSLWTVAANLQQLNANWQHYILFLFISPPLQCYVAEL